MSFIQALFFIPVVCGSVYALLSMWTVFRFRSTTRAVATRPFTEWPPVTILKPVCGLEKHLRANLRSTCIQEYPAFQVVFSVQRPDDPAIPLLEDIQREFGAERVTVAIEAYDAGPNGKINNLIGGFKHARHEILVISDSDVQLRPDYLKTIVAPLADPHVGYVCTLYKAIGAETWFEKLELLTINAELTPNMTFALVTGAAQFCLGASTAVRRSMLQQIGGLESLADYLVEDFEMGRRIWSMGQRPVILPYVVDTVVDLKTPSQWWNHLVYWDQNNRAACPTCLFGTIIIRPVPFACLFAISTLGSRLGLMVLASALAIRLVTATAVMGWGLKDAEGLRSVALVPLRDLAALASWVLAFTKRTTIWRGEAFILMRDGKLVRQNTTPCDNSLSQETTSASPSR